MLSYTYNEDSCCLIWFFEKNSKKYFTNQIMFGKITTVLFETHSSKSIQFQKS